MSLIKSQDDIKAVAQYERFLEYGVFDAQFREDLKNNTVETVKKIGIEPSYVIDENGNKDTEARRLYNDYIQAKLKMRDEQLFTSSPADESFAKWRYRQINRCRVALSKEQAEAMIHSPLMIELSRGCSVGCKFCGLSAGPLKELFRATEENKKLWAGVMDVNQRILGDGGRHGTLYFGTEPLDNPDYEYFMEDWHERYGTYNQITTAVPLRDAERTRRLVAKLDPMGDVVFRFSVKSPEDFRAIMEKFTPEELLHVELLPQFEEALGNAFVKVGRAAEDGEYAGTISCLSGILVNMCDKTIRLLTPVNASAKYPNGQVEVAGRTFADAEDYEVKLREVIDEMKTILSPKEKLRMYDYLNYQFGEDGNCSIYNPTGSGITMVPGIAKQLLERALELLKEGGYTRKEIAEEVMKIDNRMDPVSIYAMINKLWNFGVIVDNQLFGLE